MFREERCQWRLSHLWRWVEASIQTADVSRWGGCGIIPTRPVASSIARRSTEENDKSRLLLRPTYLHLLVEERLNVGGKLKQTSTRTTLDNPRAHVSCERRCCNVSPESARLQAEDAGRVAVNDEFRAHRRRRETVRCLGDLDEHKLRGQIGVLDLLLSPPRCLTSQTLVRRPPCRHLGGGNWVGSSGRAERCPRVTLRRDQET